jgi:hypothetical protein
MQTIQLLPFPKERIMQNDREGHLEVKTTTFTHVSTCRQPNNRAALRHRPSQDITQDLELPKGLTPPGKGRSDCTPNPRTRYEVEYTYLEPGLAGPGSLPCIAHPRGHVRHGR